MGDGKVFRPIRMQSAKKSLSFQVADIWESHFSMNI